MVANKHQEYQNHLRYRILSREEIELLCNPHPPPNNTGLIPLVENLYTMGKSFIINLIDN